MEFVLFLLMVTLLIVVITFKNNLFTKISRLDHELQRIRQQLADQTNVQRTSQIPTPTPSPAQSKPAAPDVSPLPGNTAPTQIPATPTKGPQIASEQILPPQRNERESAAGSEPTPAVPLAAASAAQKKTLPPKPGFFEKHPDLEKFIGENLISKIGIAILVLAIAYFVKYAIDNEWIGTVGRVAIGIACGGILTGLAHYMRNTYKAFSSVLVGGGIAVLYFTITLAYHDYHLFSQTAAFVIMVVITGFAVALSLLYNRQELAIIALIGGFATPFMVSSGSGNYITLFIYLIVLNTALLAMALKKAWRLLNILAFIFTAILFGSWIGSLSDNDPAIVSRNGFMFATIFYLLFFLINIIHNIRQQKKFIASDFGILLANTGLYFAAGLYLLQQMGAAEFRGLFCITLSVLNLAVSFLLFRKSRVDKNILYLLIGITLTFISLTAPIQLEGNNITLFWASEAVLLFWLYQKSGIRIVQLSSVIVWVAMLVSLLIDIVDIYDYPEATLPVVLNKGFVTLIVAALSSYLLFLLRRAETPDQKFAFRLIVPTPSAYRVTALVTLFLAGYLEIHHQFTHRSEIIYIDKVYLIAYTLAFIYAIVAISSSFTALRLRGQVYAGLLIAGVLIYIMQISYSFSIQRILLAAHQSGHFVAHWLGAVVVLLLVVRIVNLVRRGEGRPGNWVAWLLTTVALIFLTSEMHLFVNALFYKDSSSLATIQRVFIKAGWPILWGILSFGLMWAGMHFKARVLRIISLSVFALTLAKLFIYDIVNIPAGGKIAAFFSLGVLLLVVSFMYQRLKKIIIDEKSVDG